MTQETLNVRNRRIRNVVVAVSLLVGFAVGCGAPTVDSVIRSGSGDIVVENAE